MADLKRFTIDGIEFVQDIRAGAERGTSTETSFILVKTDRLLNSYRRLKPRAPKTILDVGLFEGGSLVFFDKFFAPEKLVGVDIRKKPIPALEAYRQDKGHISVHYGLSQDSPALGDRLAEDFPNGIDLIVDDASHLYEQTRKTFELCFPHLAPGGTYVIEDWAWSVHKQQQSPDAPWFDKPAMANLIFELVLYTGLDAQIRQMVVRPGLVIVEKKQHLRGAPPLSDNAALLRGRETPQI